ncbi:MAG: hypothetical protein BK997_01060 [Candidatus Micrarchaeum sp. ARMAN-1]|nr:MAG: hypothetical protein BK997_01060 [Candidatus Micrarchaeum sp. ARMAN-1]
MARFIRITAGANAPTGTELTASRAVGSLRGRIGSGERHGAMDDVLKDAVILFFLLAAVFMPIALLLGLPEYALSLIVAECVFVAVKAPKHTGHTEGALLLGDSYARHVLEYANYDSGAGTRESKSAELKGEDGIFRVNLAGEPNQHVMIAGSSSSGKTTTLKALLGRARLAYGIPFLAIDWQGELEGFAGDTGASLWKVPESFRLNMFRLNGMDPAQRASMVEDGLMLALHLTQLQATKAKDAAMRLYAEGREPDLESLWQELSKRRENYLIGYRLKAVERVMGEEPDEFWSGITERSNIVSLAGLNDNEKSLVTYFILQRVCELFEKGSIGSKPRLLVAIDEAWQLLSKQQQFMKMPTAHEFLAEKIVRLGRKYGFGIITSTQQLEDLPKAFVNSSSVVVLHSYRQQWKDNVMSLNALDIEYAKSASQGECLVFDRLRAQHGQTWLDYVKVKPLTDEEMEALKERASAYKPPVLEQADSRISIDRVRSATDSVTYGAHKLKLPRGAPSPTEHAALLAILANEGSDKAGLVGYVKGKGWIGSDATIYGYKGKAGIFEKAVSIGFAAEKGGRYNLTEQGRAWVDPERIIMGQSDKIGSEEHKRLLVKTIDKLHESNMLVVSPREKHSFDLVAWPVNARKRYLWDLRGAKGYEAQTSARKDSIEENMNKSSIWGVPVVWVVENEDLLKELKEVTKDYN